MEPLISVIIPVYNMEQYLARCLDSVLNNTYHNLEVVCVDDGSKDSSPEILRAYAERDGRVIVITKENGGVSSARNAGLDRMTGEYLTFVDPDDCVHPQYVELLYRALRSHDNSMAACGFCAFSDKDLPLETSLISFEPDKLTAAGSVRLFLDHNIRSYCWGKLIPARPLQGLRFREDLSYSEDDVFVAELCERNPGLVLVSLPCQLYFYYQRDGSLVSQARPQSRYRVAEICTQKVLARQENDVIYLDQAVKRGLSTRYYARHIHPDRQIARKCTALLKSCLPALWRTAVYSLKKKAVYSFFICFPVSYWLYRSITEPYMWKWEKVERKKRREARRESKT